jgi:hypothetical protein
MRKLFLSLAVICFTAFAFAQKTVQANNASARNVGTFHGISSSAGIEVLLSKDNKESVVVSADDKEVVSKIKTEVINGILVISRINEWQFWKSFHGKIKVFVGYTQLDELKASSGSSIVADDLKTIKLLAEVSSGAEISLTGSTNNLQVKGSSGGSFASYNFVSETCDAEVSSGANIKITIQKELSAKASSGGQIKYKGDAVIRNIHISSGGEVKKAK